MNAFQTCKDISDIVPLYIPQQLFLKPIAKINVSLQLPNVVKTGKSISHIEIMEKLRELLKPQEFSLLKVSKSTLEFVRFEAEVGCKKKLDAAVLKLNNKTIKLKNFSELMRVKAIIAKSEFPTRQVWDGFFNEARDMNESRPGERPDTVHISNLPCKWFVPYHLLDEEELLPSEKLFYKIFEKFGPIRYVDIPICDPYRNKMKDHISGIKNSSWDDKTMFEGYVQFKDYMGFSKCMDTLRDMKLLHKEDDEAFVVDMKADFDRSKHLSEATIRRREIVRDRLVKKQREREEKEKNEIEEKKRREEEEKKKELTNKKHKEQRRRFREEKRKAVILEKLKIKSADEINAKIAKEEKKLLKAQRKLESIRLIEELFKRIKEKKEGEEVNTYNIERSTNANNELKNYMLTSEKELLAQKQKLHSVLQGRVMLKSVLKDGKHNFSSSSSDETELPSKMSKRIEEVPQPPLDLPPSGIYQEPFMYSYPYQLPLYHHPSVRGHPAYNMFPTRGRAGYYKGPQYPSGSRGGYFNRRTRGYKSHFRGGYHCDRNQYPPELEEEYVKYFSKFLNDKDRRKDKSASPSRRSRSRSRRRSYSRSSSRSSSRYRNSRSRRRSSRDRSRSYSRRRSRSRSRRSRSRSRTRSPQSKRSTSSKHSHKSKRTPESSSGKHKDRHDSRAQSVASIDSSKFISPNKMRKERSKSWSLPRDDDKKKRDSWSRSPDKKK